jgi:lipopolysaccharide heptosyltransferase I
MTRRTPPLPSDRPPRSLLVVRLGAIGDIVRTLPAVRLLRRTWPGTRIVWAVEEGGRPLLEPHPDVDRVVVFPRRSIARGLRPPAAAGLALAWRFAAALRAERPELGLDFQGSLKSGLILRLSGAPLRVGFEPGLVRERSHLFTNVRVPLEPARIHRVERAAALARAVGAEDRPLEIELGLADSELEAGRRRREQLAGTEPPAFVAPFSSRRQSWKRYPLERWRRIVEGLRGEGLGVVVVHGPGDEQTEAERLAAESGAVPCGPASLRELAALLAAGRVMVAGDTGPMHLAWAVGLPVVALYGPTDPVLNAPFGTGHAVVAPERPAPRHAADPYAGVEPERVLAEVRRVLRPRS